MSDELISRKDPQLAYHPTTEHLADSFRDLAADLSLIGNRHDILIRAFTEDSLPHFTRLSLEGQKAAVMQLAQYVSICQDVLVSGSDLRDTRTLTWRAMGALGFVPRSDLFTTMEEDDLVEIYSTQNIQIYRNIQFFKYCSYTLEDLYTRSWVDLFGREDQTQMEKTQAHVAKMFAENSRETTFPDLGPQVIFEIDSCERRRVALEIKSAALLMRAGGSGNAEAFIAVDRAELLA